MSYRIFMRLIQGEEATLDLSEEKFRSFTGRDLERKFQQTFDIQEDVRLVYAGQLLPDYDKLIADYGIGDGSVVHGCRPIRGGGPGPAEGNMGDRDHKNLSMERLNNFQDPPLKPK